MAVLVLALSIPTLAFAAVGTFSGFVPARGAVTAASMPKVSVVIYDADSMRGAANFSLYVDGNKVPASLFRYTAYGYKKYKMSYQVVSSLGDGLHTVKARVKDRTGSYDTKSWTFTVDTTPPTTLASNGLPVYPGAWFVQLSASDAGSGVAHTYFILDGGATVSGTLAASMFAIGSHTLEFWSVDNVGNVESHHMISSTVIPVHSLPTSGSTSSCLAVGCHHAPDIATIHIQPGGPGCVACHGTLGLTATNNCLACHSGDNAPAGHAVHVAIASAAVGGKDCTASTCHGSSVMGIHGACATCHNPNPAGVIPPATVNDAIAAGVAGTPATCETCHGAYAGIHAAGNAPHAISGYCYASNCHNATDVSAVHTNGDDPPGCVACHSAGTTPSTNCIACHPNLVTVHSFVHVDASGTKSSACTTCHGTDIPTVHANVGCICHTASFLRGEMGPLLAAGKAECVDCHKGQYAAHGFASTTAAPAVGGHNTTTYGTVGAISDFSASGTVVKDDQGNTITQDWVLPTADVFWSQSSKTGTDAPAVAMANRGFASGAAGAAALNTTVGWGSVITCQDCHTNLDSSLGPQGANAGQFGLDPNFPDDWTKAEITTWDPTGMRSTDTTVGTTNPYYTKVWDTTPVTTGTPSITTTVSSGYSWGSTASRYICVKCHKLTNWKQGYPAQTRSGRSQQGMGVSNTAHMEHHPDQIRGQANCVSCHVAIPHAWSRPRLLVYSTDSAPYKAPQPSNWFYGTGGSQYLDGIYAGAYTAPASWPTPGYGKELVKGNAAFGWDQTVAGVEWIAPGTETGDNEGQPNCNACSATGGTHTPASEGVPAGLPLWK